jgi:hypothetical protein
VRSSTTPVPAWRFPSQKYSRSILVIISCTMKEKHTHKQSQTQTHTQTHIETRMTETTSFFGCFSDSSAKIHMGPAISIPETGGTANQPGEIWKSMLSMLPTARPKQLEHTHIYIYLCVYNYIDYKQYSMAHTTGRICRLLLLSPLG